MDKKERTKQFIAIELEHARLCGSIMLALITTFLGLIFLNFNYNYSLFNLIVFEAIDAFLILIAAFARKMYLTSVRNYIQKL